MIRNNEINLNTQQIYAFSEFLQTITECPISCDSMTDPSITPCGHTFDYKNICQSLEYSNKCPMDRKVITSKELIPNLFVKTLLENKVKVVFLEEKKKFQHSCLINKEPLFEAVDLPCGHTFNKSGITLWSEKIRLIEMENQCPLDNKKFDVSEIVDNIERRNLTEDEYPKYIEEIKVTNLEWSQKVINLQLDDRNQWITKLFQIIKCPISQEIIKSPVLGPCGHTFDVNSIEENSFCPLDKVQLNTKNIVPNLIAKDILEFLDKTLCEKSEKLQVPEIENKQGVLLSINQETTPRRIIEIAKSLGIYPQLSPQSRSTPQLQIVGYQLNIDTPIFQVKRVNQTDNKIPSFNFSS